MHRLMPGDSSDSSVQNSSPEWLLSNETDEKNFNLFDPFVQTSIPLDKWTEIGLEWLVANFRPAFQAIRVPVDAILSTIEGGLLGASPLLLIIAFTLFAWATDNFETCCRNIWSVYFYWSNWCVVRGNGDPIVGSYSRHL